MFNCRCFHDLSIVLFFLAVLFSLLGPLGIWHQALPVGVCIRECDNNSNIGCYAIWCNVSARRSAAHWWLLNL